MITGMVYIYTGVGLAYPASRIPVMKLGLKPSLVTMLDQEGVNSGTLSKLFPSSTILFFFLN